MSAADGPPLTVAAFDVDGTLTRRDCVVPFLVRLVGWPRLVAIALSRPLLLFRTAIGRGDRDRVKAHVVGRAVRGIDARRLSEEGSRFATTVASNWLRSDVMGRLSWHREQGHRIVLVSASLRPYLEPFAEHVLGGVDAVLCTDVEIGPDGRCTGRLAGRNCRGPEKARRLSDWVPASGAVIWAYGDSAGDREMLAMAHHPLLVRGAVIEPVPDGGGAQ